MAARWKSTYNLICGVGVIGFALSGALLGLFWLLDQALGPPRITGSFTLRLVVLIAGVAAAFVLIQWSNINRVPAQLRGEMCTWGVYRWVRHPLYAALISMGCVGLAFFLNSYLYFLWVLSLYPLWGRLIKKEEETMAELFGDAYREYAARTGRFFHGRAVWRRLPRVRRQDRPVLPQTVTARRREIVLRVDRSRARR
jgi:protein-S-isoprenylcysteine O-methyltransferase Ste14